MVKQLGRVFRLGVVQMAAVVVVLALAVWSGVALLWPRLAMEYVLTVRAPGLERAFGFRGEYVERVYVLTEVAETGRLYAAGFRPGDRPSAGICRYEGDYVSAKAFLDELDRVMAGQKVETFVMRPGGEGHAPARVVILPNEGVAGR